MGRLNNDYVDNGDVKVHPSGYLFEYTSGSVSYPGTPPIKSTDGDEIYHLLELFY